MKRFRPSLFALFGLLISFAIEAAEIEQTRGGWLDRCSNEPRAEVEHGTKFIGLGGALAAVLAPRLIDAVVDHVTAGIRAGAEAESRVSVATPWLGHFYRVTATGELGRNAGIGCLVVIQGRYDTIAVPFGSAMVGDGLKSADIRFEAKLVSMPGLRYFQLVPQVLEVNRLSTNSFWTSDRDLAIAVSLAAVGAAQPFASATFNFRGVAEGMAITAPEARLAAAASPPIPYPADLGDANLARAQQAARAAPYLIAMRAIDQRQSPSVPAIERPDELLDTSVVSALKPYCERLAEYNKGVAASLRVVDDRCAHGLAVARDALEKAIDRWWVGDAAYAWARRLCPDYEPRIAGTACSIGFAEGIEQRSFGAFTTSAVVTEVRNPGRFAEMLAKAIGGSAAEVKTVLKDHLPEAREKASAARADADRLARRALIIADLEVQRREAVLEAVQGDQETSMAAVLAAQIDLAKAKISANDAYRKAGLEVPYPEYD
jgi:hypothetical protein